MACMLTSEKSYRALFFNNHGLDSQSGQSHCGLVHEKNQVSGRTGGKVFAARLTCFCQAPGLKEQTSQGPST